MVETLGIIIDRRPEERPHIVVVYEFTPIVLALFIFLLLNLVLFPSLTIEIDKTKFTIRFGLGLLVKILI